MQCRQHGCQFLSYLAAHQCKKELLVSPMEVSDERCFGVLPENTGLLRVLNHGMSIFGDEYGLNHAYQYLNGLMTYTLRDQIRDYFDIFFEVLLGIYLGLGLGMSSRWADLFWWKVKRMLEVRLRWNCRLRRQEVPISDRTAGTSAGSR